MGIDCRLDLGRGSDVAGSDERMQRLVGVAVPALTYDAVGGMKRVPRIFFRDDSFGNAAPVAWSGQACTAQLDLVSESSPLHHEVSLIGVRCLSGLRGKISIISMRPW